MHDRWAALLANAADPQSDEVPPSFPDILKQLQPDDARVLDGFYQERLERLGPESPIYSGMWNSAIEQALGLGHEKFQLSVENLYRLRLLTVRSHYRVDPTSGEVTETPPMASEVSRLGQRFVQACQPPQSNSEATH